MTASSKSQPKMVDMKKEDSSSDDDINDDDEALLEQCIQAGITGVNVVGAKFQVPFFRLLQSSNHITLTLFFCCVQLGKMHAIECTERKRFYKRELERFNEFNRFGW